jgi:hypothetical protein
MKYQQDKANPANDVEVNLNTDGDIEDPGGIIVRVDGWKQNNFLNCFILSTQVYKGVNMVKTFRFTISFL